MKIFLTGGTGFIGSHLINEAHKRGYEIRALRRPGSKSRIKLDKQPYWIEGSLDGNYLKALSNCNVFIHLATFGASPQPANWSDCFFWNVTKSIDLLKQALDSGIDKIISVGTYAEYGEAGLKFDFIPPDSILNPIGPYATSKAVFGMAMYSLCNEYDVNSIYFRLFSIYGEGQNEKNFYPALKKAAISGNDFPMTPGEQIRDFLSVEETVRRILNGLNFDKESSKKTKFLNIGSGKPQTILSFAKENWSKLNAKGRLQVGHLPYRKNEIMRYVALIEK